MNFTFKDKYELSEWLVSVYDKLSEEQLATIVHDYFGMFLIEKQELNEFRKSLNFVLSLEPHQERPIFFELSE